MPIVVDTNALALVFNPECDGHREFKPVADWILKGPGRAVFGGSKYKDELRKARTYLKLFLILRDSGRAVEIKDDVVDACQKRLVGLTRGTEFNDQHIVALLCASGCRLVCSRDKRSYEFIKDKTYYPKTRSVPKIYCSLRNKKLLCGKNCVELLNIA